MQFGEKLKSLRDKHHLTQTDVAKALGVTQRAISYYENNNVAPNDPEALNKLAKLFGMTLDDLMLKNEGSTSRLHALVEKLLTDTQNHNLGWDYFDEASFLEVDDYNEHHDRKYTDTFNYKELPQYTEHKLSSHESYLASYKNGGYLIAKLISPNGEVEIALFVLLNGKFLYIANNNSIKQIDDLYLLLVNSSSGVNLFIDQYLSDDLSQEEPRAESFIIPDDDIPF